MGATSYRWLLDNEIGADGGPAWPYDVPCWVSPTSSCRPSRWHQVRTGTGVGPARGDACRRRDRNVWVVGGGDLAGQFADCGLLDEVWVQFAPVSLGAGAPLLPRRLELRLEEVARNADFACARYSVVR
jgi:dihydrofolate reductase